MLRTSVPFDRAIRTNSAFQTEVKKAVNMFSRSMRRYDQDTMAFGKYMDVCRDEFRKTLRKSYKGHNIDRSTLTAHAAALIQAVTV